MTCWSCVRQAVRVYSLISPPRRFSADLLCVYAGHGGARSVRFVVGDALGDALVRPGRVVVRLVLGQDGAQMPLAEDQHPVEEFSRRVPTRRSQIAFIRGAWTAVRRILAPAAWNTASNAQVKFDPRSRIRNLMFANLSSRARAGCGPAARSIRWWGSR